MQECSSGRFLIETKWRTYLRQINHGLHFPAVRRCPAACEFTRRITDCPGKETEERRVLTSYMYSLRVKGSSAYE